MPVSRKSALVTSPKPSKKIVTIMINSRDGLDLIRKMENIQSSPEIGGVDLAKKYPSMSTCISVSSAGTRQNLLVIYLVVILFY